MKIWVRSKVDGRKGWTLLETLIPIGQSFMSKWTVLDDSERSSELSDTVQKHSQYPITFDLTKNSTKMPQCWIFLRNMTNFHGSGWTQITFRQFYTLKSHFTVDTNSFLFRRDGFVQVHDRSRCKNSKTWPRFDFVNLFSVCHRLHRFCK